MNSKILIISILITILSLKIQASSFQQLDALVQQKFSDQSSIIRLANQQKFQIPLNGRYISYNIKYFPQNANDCQFKQPTVEYKKLAQSSRLFEQDDEIVATLVLKKEQKIILADPYYNIVIYSTDQHKLLRLLSPKTSLLSSNSKSGKQMVNTLSMITTQQQNFIYYLSPGASFVFSSKSFGTQIQKLNIVLPAIQKAIYYKNHIVILSPDQGIFVYKLNKTNHLIQKMQTIKNQKNHQFIDIQFDSHNQLFYVLTQSSIYAYLFQPSKFPNPQDQKQFVILHVKDQINLLNHTRNHVNTILQNNQHLNLQIAPSATSTGLFVLFRHLRQNVIAQFVYQPNSLQITFLRYFKFQMQIKQIHTIQDVIVVVGQQILGMFPYGIDPRLITQQFNGWMALSDIEKVVITQAPYFVGITKNSIQYGGLLFTQQIGLNCKFNQSSLTKSISFSGNLTWCSKDQVHEYNEYCSYSKTFIIESMDIVTTSTVSSSIWVAIIICTIAIIFGILIMLIMHKKKQEEIKKLQFYFQQRRRTQLPATSDRRGTQDKF